MSMSPICTGCELQHAAAAKIDRRGVVGLVPAIKGDRLKATFDRAKTNRLTG